jgi:hypothetical protein
VVHHQELLNLEGERGIGTALVIGELDLEHVRRNLSRRLREFVQLGREAREG